VRYRSSSARLSRTRRLSAFAVFATMLAIGVGGCTAPAEVIVNKIRSEADVKCQEGNQPACDTVVQTLSSTKVAIESTSSIATLTPECNSGKHESCEQLAVLHAELMSWCSMGNARACAAVNAGKWPAKWDEPALIDAAKLSCMSGKLKQDSNTCQALDYL
jgi:hypothetical protein